MSKGKKNIFVRVIVLLIYLFSTGITGVICAQETIPHTSHIDTIVTVVDSITAVNIPDSHANDSITSIFESVFFQHADSILHSFSEPPVTIIQENVQIVIDKDASTFKPNPKISWKVAIIFPGFGQIYNRQYWKLPIVYGGLMGCAYAITWNNKTYQDYKNAYFDIMVDSRNDPKGENPDSWSQSWQDFVPSTSDKAARLQDKNFHTSLKRGKDYFRRYRDLSIIIGGAIYMIFVADAYVDAQMFDFDISPDLSFRVTPEFRPETLAGSRYYGFNICMTF